MLVLTRKNRESVVIGQPGEMRIALEITILEIEGGRVRIGFEADTKLQSYLEKDLVEVYVGLKRNEWKRWESAVTDWEQGEYARVY